MIPVKFTEKSLPIAVGNLLAINNYDVRYDVHIHGAQIDIVANSRTDPFANTLYIEVTVEYVSTEKYGKDTTKFLLVKHKLPNAACLCVSSKGFTAFVKERALESGIIALSYDDLFRKFEKFDPYITKILNDKDYESLDTSYEEPYFDDKKGADLAIDWLGKWGNEAAGNNWLIILGEYGTGKTALTKVLQRRWIDRYKFNPHLPMPIRIELKNFTRQFDARGLLHHFLDTNDLGHISIEFVFHLIKTGRVILLLDGYDEMAQFLNARERRACLSALAELSSDGAKGLLTSRPNYFTEAEELSVFEALYLSIDHNRYQLSKLEKSIIDEEKSVDKLVESYVLERYERNLQDLSPEQTESLVRRNLKDDADGQRIVIDLLKKVFRVETDGHQRSLSGKPVIVSYVLQTIEDFRGENTLSKSSHLSEWQIYKMIVDKLMFRDMRRSVLNPHTRRQCLQKIAIILSGKNKFAADETTFHTIIEDEFRLELRRLPPDERRSRREELYLDLRSSATLTRRDHDGSDGFVFSHNSLREYLTTEIFVNKLLERSPIEIKIPITSVMRGFAAAMPEEDRSNCWQSLVELWPQRTGIHSLGSYLALLWNVAQKRKDGLLKSLMDLAYDKSADTVFISDISLKHIDFSTRSGIDELRINASNAELDTIIFDGVDLEKSDFRSAVLDGVSFKGSNLEKCTFAGAIIYECDFCNASVTAADFSGVDPEISIFAVAEPGVIQHYQGSRAIGYLSYKGAITDNIDNYSKYSNHRRFDIVVKIIERLKDQRHSQLRGLTQRGEAHIDPPFARSFINKLVACGFVSIERNELVFTTPLGRNAFTQFFVNKIMPQQIADFLEERR